MVLIVLSLFVIEGVCCYLIGENVRMLFYKYFLKKCLYIEILIKFYSLIFLFVLLCSNKKYV